MQPTVVTALGSAADSQIERELLQAVDANLVHVASFDAPEDRAIIRQADALIVTIHRVSADLIASMERCRIISRAGTGLDAIDIPAATAHGIWVAYVPDYSVDEVSSHAIGLLLSHARAIPQLIESARAGQWSNQVAIPRRRLRGQTLGLLGFGRIGQALAVEPPSPDHPLLHDPRVMITPHTGWYSEDANYDVRVRAVEEVVRVLRGERPRCPVNEIPPR